MKKAPNLIRFALAVIFILGALANITMLITVPDTYRDFAIDAFFPFYRQLWDSLVYPNLWIFVIGIVLFEIYLAVLLLSKENKVKLGLWLSTAYMVALIPFWWFGGALINVAFLIIFIWLTRFSYPMNIKEFFKSALGHPG